MLGQSWFDILHPKDIAKVKEQLSSSDLSPRERLIDAKSKFKNLDYYNYCFFSTLAMLPVRTDEPHASRLCPGARRSFFCRMKCKSFAQIKEENETTITNGAQRKRKQQGVDKKYSVIQCTGYLKSWGPAKMNMDEQETDGDNESCNLSCLVAIGRMPPDIFAPALNTPVHSYINVRSIQFMSRHAIDGKFIFVDQRYGAMALCIYAHLKYFILF